MKKAGFYIEIFGAAIDENGNDDWAGVRIILDISDDMSDETIERNRQEIIKNPPQELLNAVGIYAYDGYEMRWIDKERYYEEYAEEAPERAGEE